MAGSLGTCAGYIRHHTTMIKRYTLLLPVVLLAMTSYAQPTNDECVTAISVTCGQTVSGSTSLALPDEATNCGTSVGAPGVWYVLQGTDAMVTATTCPDNTYDTKLNVYVGNCGTITCVAGNDDIAGGVLCSSVSFAAPVGQTFYILVQGYNGAVGAFDLAITLSPEADAYAREMAKTMAIEVEYWPTPDPSTAQGSREQILESYRDVRRGLEKRLKERFG